MHSRERNKKRLIITLSAQAACLTAATLIITIMLIDAHRKDQTNTCVENLRKIEAGKEAWALEQGKNGVTLYKDEIDTFILGGTPLCPANGTYDYTLIGTDATCSLGDQGHALP